MRIARGGVEIDTSGKRAGRGTYLCPSRECWQTGLKGDRIGYVLRTTLTQDNREQLISYGNDLLQGVNQW